MELSGTTTFRDFDGYGQPNRLGDHLLSLSVGFTFHLGKVGWKRAVDAAPYIRQNERLVDYTNFLLGENRRYTGRHDRDKRTLAELKKIMEIEGLLDIYSHLFDADDTADRRFPVNDYSGLNSLRARLRHKHWDGTSPLDTMVLLPGNENPACKYSMSSGHQDSLSTDYTAFLYTDSECIGSPVYFFFSLNTAHLTDVPQMLNLDEMARVAKKYGLSVRFTGAADSSTGTPGINYSLSVSRAGFIATELIRRGISDEHITRTGRGGIADHTPTEANRHTKVELFFSEAK